MSQSLLSFIQLLDWEEHCPNPGACFTVRQVVYLEKGFGTYRSYRLRGQHFLQDNLVSYSGPKATSAHAALSCS